MLAGGRDQVVAVAGVGDVAGDRGDFGELAELARDALEVVRAAGVEHERVVVGGELAGEREPEPARCSGDDC